MVIGYDHRFGRNRNANINDLRAFGAALDFEVEEIPAQEIDDVSVSSTKIRKCLLAGDVATANKYLGYDFMITGTVQKGKELGRQLGFPTANLVVEETYKLIPKSGSYVVRSTIDGQQVHGMMNIGRNPTVAEEEADGKPKNIEVHFFDFEGDLYGQKLQIDILDRIRDEHKFDSVEQLRVQLQKDKETALKLIA